LDVDSALEILSEYLASFLASEHDWSVIDNLRNARSYKDALEAHTRALRSIQKVLESERSGFQYEFLLRLQLAKNEKVRGKLKEGIVLTKSGAELLKREKFSELFNRASKRFVEELKRRDDVRELCLELIERTLAKYPTYMEWKKSEGKEGG